MKNIYRFVISLTSSILIFGFQSSFGQGVSINGTNVAPDAQAILDITSNTKGVLLPRMTNAEATTLAASLDAGDDGMIIYVTDNSIKAFKYWDGQGLTWRIVPNTNGIVTSLDEAYDGLSSGAGRVITADAGAVDIQGANGLIVAGNVGVGNTNSDYKLQVSGGTGGAETTLLNLHSNSSADETGSIIRFTNSTSTVSSPGSGEIAVRRTNRDATGDAAMFFRTSNGSGAPADRMAILDNGNVGIGTSIPSYKLDINGDINLTTAIRVNGDAGTNGYVLTSSGGGAVTWQPSYDGDITSVVAGAGLITGGITGDVTVDAAADNGLNVDATADRIQLGGNITEATTLTLTSTYDLTINANGTGKFVVQDGGVDHFEITANGDAIFGSNTYFKDNNTGGTNLVKISDAGTGGDDGKIEIFKDGVVNHTIHGDGDVIFNAQGVDRDFQVETVADPYTLYLEGSSNNVGIGTNIPYAKLNVANTTGPSVLLMREDATTLSDDVLGSILFDSNDDTSPSTTDASAGIRAYASVDHGNSNKGAYLSFFTKNNVGNTVAATERMKILANGNIGIGAPAPAQKLEVAGNVRVTGLSAGGNVQANTSGDLIISNNVPGGDADYIHNQNAAAQSASQYWISGNGRMNGGLTVGAGATIDNNNINTGTVANGLLAFGSASGEGIGSKRNAGGNQFGLDFYTNSLNRLAINNSGSVGINNTNPSNPLHVVAPSTTAFDVARFDGSNTLGTGVRINSTAAGGRTWNLISTANAAGEGAGKLLFKDETGGNVRMTLESGGDVGIGTTDPRAKLNIGGNGTAVSGNGIIVGSVGLALSTSVAVGAETGRFEIAFPGWRDVEPNQIGAKIAAIRINNYQANNALVQSSDLAFFTGSGSTGGSSSTLLDITSEKMRITSGGNIGIGTSTPTAKLEVAGTVKLTGGSPGAGKVLTSDADGDASWQNAGVPSGAVMFFNLAGCPTGWSDMTGAQGRYIVGLPSGGTLGGTAGTALSNQENRASGTHTHTVDPPNTNTNTAGNHNHDFYTATNDVNSEASQGYPAGNNHSAFRTTDRRQETRDNGTIIAEGNHTHSIDISQFNSGSSGSVAGTNAPYIQLKVCQKD